MKPGSRLYDDPALAAAYVRVSGGNVANAEYERPAVHELLGDVRGLDVLDAGAAAGDHSAWLVEHGARVVALDVSDAMVHLARERLGESARVVQADLADRLPFSDAAFDLVLSSLTLHYLRDWLPPLREFARVLRLSGRVVISTHHPYAPHDSVVNYHAIEFVDDAWDGFDDEPVAVRYWHRPLEQIIEDLHRAGFVLRRVREPKPTADADTLEPELAAYLRTRPGFLILEAERGAR